MRQHSPRQSTKSHRGGPAVVIALTAALLIAAPTPPSGDSHSDVAAEAAAPPVDEAATQRMVERVSRAAARPSISAGLDESIERAGDEAGATVAAERAAAARRDPHGVARRLAAEYGWGSGQFTCLVSLWNNESDWEWDATNPTSGAYGIPQSLPPEKMASAGADWKTNPETQIRWGLEYIHLSYGTPCVADQFQQANSWY